VGEILIFPYLEDKRTHRYLVRGREPRKEGNAAKKAPLGLEWEEKEGLRLNIRKRRAIVTIQKGGTIRGR